MACADTLFESITLLYCQQYFALLCRTGNRSSKMYIPLVRHVIGYICESPRIFYGKR
jgi:hypothetical protein